MTLSSRAHFFSVAAVLMRQISSAGRGPRAGSQWKSRVRRGRCVNRRSNCRRACRWCCGKSGRMCTRRSCPGGARRTAALAIRPYLRLARSGVGVKEAEGPPSAAAQPSLMPT
jgi:hypothetical protein